MPSRVTGAFVLALFLTAIGSPHPAAALSVNGGSLLPPISASGSETWADPPIAMRAILPIRGGLFANAIGDVGGGPEGDPSWQIYGGLGYDFNQTVAALVGWRYLAMNP